MRLADETLLGCIHLNKKTTFKGWFLFAHHSTKSFAACINFQGADQVTFFEMSEIKKSNYFFRIFEYFLITVDFWETSNSLKAMPYTKRVIVPSQKFGQTFLLISP